LQRKAFDRRASLIGLSLVQARALVYVARHEGIRQAGLSDLLEVQPITLTRLLDRMESAGWIERRPDPDDRRVHRLHLSDKAWPILERIEELSAAMRAEMLGCLSDPEKQTVTDLLARIHAAMSERGKSALFAPTDNNKNKDTKNGSAE
jgi:DNA-binding MarR family transcriptional regulator